MVESPTICVLSEHVRSQIDAWLEKYPSDQRRSGVLFALRIVQEENGGWLTMELMDAVADYLGINHVGVYEVATFYSMYDLQPVGQHKIKVCTSISCMLRGSDKIIAHLHDRFGIRPGETLPDGLFTLKETECLAACVNAPALQIDDKIFVGDITPEKIDLVIDELRNKRVSDDG